MRKEQYETREEKTETMEYAGYAKWTDEIDRRYTEYEFYYDTESKDYWVMIGWLKTFDGSGVLSDYTLIDAEDGGLRGWVENMVDDGDKGWEMEVM